MNVLTALFVVPALRRRALVTLALLGAAFTLSHLPVPGVDAGTLVACSDAAVGGVLGVANFFGGGAVAKMSWGAVGVMPFITATIIVILAARIAAPVGQIVAARGRSFYVTVGLLATGLAGGQALATAVAASQPNGLLPGCAAPVLTGGSGAVVPATAAMLGGTVALLTFGWGISRWGLGNGVSLLIALGVLTVVPRELVGVGLTRGPVTAAAAVGMLVILVVGLVWLNARKVYLHASLGWLDETDPRARRALPFPLNPAGVMPIILATTLINGPLVLAMVTPGDGWPQRLADVVSAPTSGWHLLGVAAATVALTYYWTIVTWDADQMSAGFAKHDVHVDGAADGEQTARAVDALLLRTTTISAVLMAALAVLPSAAIAVLGTSARFPLGGATLLVMVAIGADTVKRVRADVRALTESTNSGGEDATDQVAPDGAVVFDGSLDEALVSLGRVQNRLV